MQTIVLQFGPSTQASFERLGKAIQEVRVVVEAEDVGRISRAIKRSGVDFSKTVASLRRGSGRMDISYQPSVILQPSCSSRSPSYHSFASYYAGYCADYYLNQLRRAEAFARAAAYELRRLLRSVRVAATREFTTLMAVRYDIPARRLLYQDAASSPICGYG